MKKLFLWLVVLLGVLASNSPSLAQSVLAEYAHVTKVNVGEDRHLYINVKGNFKTTHNCSNRAFARSLYPLGDDRTKAWLQIATASFLSQSKVHVWTRGCVGVSGTGYPVLVKLQMFQ